MSELRVELESPEAGFRPGETIRGTAAWSLDEEPEGLEAALEVRLFWFTRGTGDQDVGVVETAALEGAGREGSRSFSFKAPPAPLSFSGKLISLTWAVELVALPRGEAGRRELVISHTGEEIRIDTSSVEALEP